MYSNMVKSNGLVDRVIVFIHIRKKGEYIKGRGDGGKGGNYVPWGSSAALSSFQNSQPKVLWSSLHEWTRAYIETSFSPNDKIESSWLSSPCQI